MNRLPAILASLALLPLGSCQRGSIVDQANRDGMLLVGNSAEPRTLDLQIVSGVPESKILSSLFEGLVADHPSEDNTMAPGVATHWDHNADLTEWTFHLRPEAKWSDGKPLTAQDFLFTYHRMLHPEFAAAYAQMLHVVRNAEIYNADERGHILCGLDPSFPVPWDILRTVNFRGIHHPELDDLKQRDFHALDHAEKQSLLEGLGLDRMKADHLNAILADPTLFPWPPGVPENARPSVLRRLLDHVEAGAPDLFEKADVGFRAPDPHTLVVHLREPVPYLPSMTRHTSWLPVPPHAILRFGRMTDRDSEWSRKGNLVCNGPFQIHEWRYNHYIEVRRNPHYWDAKNVALNGIRFFPIENPYTETRAFLAGQLHTTYSLPPDLLRRTRTQHPQFLRTEPYVGTVFLRFNTTRPALNHPKVRQALSLAIHREEMCRYVFEGYTPATGLTPKLGDYEPVDFLRYDPAKAKALLAEAGYPDGKGLPTLTLLVSNRPNQSIDAIQAYFRKLGVIMTVDQKDWGSFIATQQELNYDISIGGWIGDYLDATTFLDLWTRHNGNNNSGWSDPQYEDLLRKAAQQADPAQRARVLAEAEILMLKAAPIIPIAWYSRIYLHRPEVRGWHPLVLDNHPWDHVSLDPGP